MWPNYPVTERVGTAFKSIQIEKGKFTVVYSRSPQNLEFGHFMLLFGRERQKNVPKFKTHVQGIVLLIKSYYYTLESLSQF